MFYDIKDALSAHHAYGCWYQYDANVDVCSKTRVAASAGKSAKVTVGGNNITIVVNSNANGLTGRLLADESRGMDTPTVRLEKQ